MNEDKLQSFIQIGDQLKALSDQIRQRINEMLEQAPLDYRGRVLVGLGLKAYRCFEVLHHLAEQRRSESLILLKTLVETWIYLHYVAQDPSDQGARLLIAKSYAAKVSFFEKNPDYPNQANYLDSWRKAKDNQIQNLTEEWKNFKTKTLEQIACSINRDMGRWYYHVYKLACEPAHIADLVEHMPASPQGPISLDLESSRLATLMSVVALDYGLLIMIDILRNASELFSLGFEADLGSIEQAVMSERQKIA